MLDEESKTFLDNYKIWHLKRRQPVKVTLLEGARLESKKHATNRVRISFVNGFKISTVLLQVSTRMDDNPAFETMIFSEKSNSIDLSCWRCTKWRDALDQHWQAVKYCKDWQRDNKS